jgi:hypothetical protein
MNSQIKLEFQLLSMYDGAPMIPADVVARDWFGLTAQKFLEKCRSGSIRIAIVNMGETQKSKKMVTVSALAAYMIAKSAEAQRDLEIAFG